MIEDGWMQLRRDAGESIREFGNAPADAVNLIEYFVFEMRQVCEQTEIQLKSGEFLVQPVMQLMRNAAPLGIVGVEKAGSESAQRDFRGPPRFFRLHLLRDIPERDGQSAPLFRE